MDKLFLVLYWTGPIGVGIFLICLGTMIWLLTKADEVSKRTKAFVKEKGLDKNIESARLTALTGTSGLRVTGHTTCFRRKVRSCLQGPHPLSPAPPKGAVPLCNPPGLLLSVGTRRVHPPIFPYVTACATIDQSEAS